MSLQRSTNIDSVNTTEKTFIDQLLGDYSELLTKETEPLHVNHEYMQLTELRFLIKNIRELTDIQLYQAYSKAEVYTVSQSIVVQEKQDLDVKKTVTDRKHLLERIQYLDALLINLKQYIASRLELTVQSGASLPRIVQLCDKYHLTTRESDIFHLMNVIQGSNDAHVLNTLIEEDYLRKVTGFQRISGMSEIDIDIFCDGERAHMKEGIVLVDEDNGTQFNLRIQRVAVQLIYGRKVKADDLLKISATSMEEILNKESDSVNTTSDAQVGAKRKHREERPLGKVSSEVQNPTILRIVDMINNQETQESITELVATLSAEEKEALQAAVNGMEGSLRDEDEDDNEGDEMESDVDGSDDGDSDDDDDSAGQSDAEDVSMPISSPETRSLHHVPLVRVNSHTSATSRGSFSKGSPRAKLRGQLSPRSTLAKKKSTFAEDSEEQVKKSRKLSVTATPFPFGLTANTSFGTVDSDVIESALRSGGNKSNKNLIGNILDNKSHLVVADESASTLKPYLTSNQLEYLEDSFQLVALMIKGNVARLKDDMKKEGTSRYNSYSEGAGELKHSKRELAAKLKLHENRVQMRLHKTIECGFSLPRLEIMSSRFRLDAFEKKIILLLIGKTVSPIVKTLMETLDTSGRSQSADDVLTVGQTLSILCQDFNSQISHRKYFYQSSRLMTNAVISLSKSRWHVGTGDLTENRIILDRRILDWVVGLDSEINELVEGSDLYEPVVDLTQVVLPAGYSEAILSQCQSYDEFQRYRLTVGLEKTLTYGNSLVILLCGKSGTGKTMTVNAIAHELKKKVLLVDFNSLINKKDNGSDLEVDLKGLFRESKMSNAVLFFDECEVVFKSRNLGSDRLLNSLLTEIERHEGIVFMATNRPYEIDEAMHRRITMVLEYREPDYDMRKEIWDNLLGISSHSLHAATTTVSADKDARQTNGVADALLSDTTTAKKSKSKSAKHPSSVDMNVETTAEVAAAVKKGLSLHADVDTSVLAIKYELTGGFIKNAVLSALLGALSRHKTEPVICQQDLIDGCKLQMRGNLTQRNFEDRSTNRTDISLAKLHLTKVHREAVSKIIRHEQARAKVYGSWNTPVSVSADKVIAPHPTRCEQRASIHLFAGTRGSGKNSLVKTIAAELGDKKTKYVHMADFVSSSISEITLIFKTLVQDARLMDALVVVDGFEHVMDDGGDSGGGGSASKMHLILSRIMDILFQYHGCVFLLCHIENPQNIMLQRDFASRLLTFIRFTIPPHEIRSQLWQSLMPTSAPLSTDINFEVLGRRFEMNAGSIRSSIANATAEVAMRVTDCVVHQTDLLAAGDYELSKLKGGNFELVSKLFT